MYLKGNRGDGQVAFRRLLAGRLCLLAAMAASLYLAWTSLSHSVVAGCDGGACDKVLASRWSSLLGIPVSLLGTAVYGILLAGSWVRRPQESGRFVHAVISLTILFGAAWFVALQIWVVKEFCPWCCATHGLAVCGVLFLWRGGKMWRGDRLGFSRVALPLGALTCMALVQAMQPPQENIAQSKLAEGELSQEDGVLYLYGGRVRLDVDALPQQGGVENGSLAVLVSDYTCPHCLDLQRNLREYEKVSGGRLRVLFLPGFHEVVAREIHRTLLVLWRVDPELYRRVTEALQSGELAVDYGELQAYVEKNYAGRFDLDRLTYAKWAGDVLDQGKKLMELNAAASGQTALPQLMLGQKIIVGTPRVETIRELVQRTAKVKTGTPARIASAVPEGMVSPAKAGFSYENERLDLGKIIEGSQKTLRYTFTNTTAKDLSIAQIYTSCGCAQAEGWRQTVPPGGRGHFDIRFNSARLHGEVQKVITVKTNHNERHRVFFEARVWSPARLFPSRISFGSVVRGEQAKARTVNVILTDDTLNSPGEFRSQSPVFTTKLRELEAGKKFALTVSLDSSRLGRFQGALVADLPLAEFPELRLPVSAKVVRPLVVSPQELTGRADSARAKTRQWTFRVLCHDDFRKNFKILSASYRGAQKVRVTLADPGKNPSRLSLELPEDFSYAEAQKAGAELLIRTNHEKMPELVVPVRLAP